MPNILKRILDQLCRMNALLTERAELHGRYCIADAKIRQPRRSLPSGKAVPAR
ncbi:hypothetical protein [Bosea sp. 117]|uniref:hypothetical protein n=1 Tax=Bosea sp. 117 TaxID=1125973 RepID=UPI000A83021A|nr:hypothetical protein [Bosea sp. 117]